MERNLYVNKILHAIGATVAYWDKKRVCRFANDAYMEWFGRSANEMVDKITMEELLGPLYKVNLPYIEAALQGKKQVFEREILTPSGEVRYAMATYTPDILDGVVEGMIVHMVDITAIKILEEKMKESLAVSEKQNERLKNFAEIVAHNLRSQSGNFKLLLEFFLKDNPEYNSNEYISLLQLASENLQDTIVSLSEIVDQYHKKEIQLLPVKLQLAVESAVNSTKGFARKFDVDVSSDVPADLVVLGNPAYVESIVLNLVTNAIKYRSDNRSRYVKIHARESGEKILMEVLDNGVGIDLKRNAPRIFRLFQTFHGNQDARGIGLFITKNQIESMGGSIFVESQVDEGTTFRVFFQKARWTGTALK